MFRIVRSEIISRQGKYPFALSSENMALESDILVKSESANAVVGKRCTFGPNYQVSPTITKRQTFPESCSHWKVGKYALCLTLNIFPGIDPRFKEFKEVAIQTKESNCFDHVAIHTKNKRWKKDREKRKSFTGRQYCRTRALPKICQQNILSMDKKYCIHLIFGMGACKILLGGLFC